MYAQDKTPTDDLGNVSDDFQENFFEALKQKGIENYELALNALEKAEVAAGDNQVNKAVVYFEKGKNLAFLKRFEDAENLATEFIEKGANSLKLKTVNWSTHEWLHFIKHLPKEVTITQLTDLDRNFNLSNSI